MILFPTRVTLTLLEQKLKKTDTRMSRIRDIGLVTARLSRNRSPKKREWYLKLNQNLYRQKLGQRLNHLSLSTLLTVFLIFGL